jgi:hypothetical protein
MRGRVSDLVVGRWILVDRWRVFGLWTLTGRWFLAGSAVVGIVVGVGLVLLANRLPKSAEGSAPKALLGLLALVFASVLLFDIVWVVEAIAHVIWPNFVDDGS